MLNEIELIAARFTKSFEMVLLFECEQIMQPGSGEPHLSATFPLISLLNETGFSFGN